MGKRISFLVKKYLGVFKDERIFFLISWKFFLRRKIKVKLKAKDKKISSYWINRKDELYKNFDNQF